jgi:hypothetical protein
VTDLADAFVRELYEVLGDRVVSVFMYGAAMFPPAPVTDFDAHVVVNTAFDAETSEAVRAMHERLHSVPMGDDMDVWYVSIDAAKTSSAPRDQRHGSLFDESWPLHCAHVHAGRYKTIAGTDPRTFVPVPTWDQLSAAMQHELEWLSARVEQHPEYCVLNLCRIACSYANRDVVVSKLQGALWALAALPDEHHATIRAALDAYRTKTFGKIDARAFLEVMRPVIEKL